MSEDLKFSKNSKSKEFEKNESNIRAQLDAAHKLLQFSPSKTQQFLTERFVENSHYGEIFEKIIELFREAPGGNLAVEMMVKKKAREHYDQGTMFYKTGNYDQAVEKFKEAATVQPTEYAYHFCQGAAYKMDGLYSEAINCFMTALFISNKYLEPFEQLLECGLSLEDAPFCKDIIDAYENKKIKEPHIYQQIVQSPKGKVTDEKIQFLIECAKMKFSSDIHLS